MNTVEQEYEPATDEESTLRIKEQLDQLSLLEEKTDLLLQYLRKYLATHFQLPHVYRARIWNLILLDKNEEPVYYCDRITLKNVLQSLPLTSKEQIWLDVSRLRPGLKLFKRPHVRLVAYSMLCMFCYQRELLYFQGLHEILAPFLSLFQNSVLLYDDQEVLQQNDAVDLYDNDKIVDLVINSPLWNAYPLFSNFVDRFAPFLLEKSEEMLFHLLKKAFHYFQQVILYHLPSLFWLLMDAEITPDMFGLSWFATLFARNFGLEELFALYDCLLVTGNVMGIFYFGLEILRENEEQLLRVFRASLPETLMNLRVVTKAKVWNTWKGAINLQQQTPMSFTRRFYEAMYVHLTEKEQVEEEYCMHVQVEDWLENSFIEGLDNDSEKVTKCLFFIWDCRSKEEFDAGHLAVAARIPWESFDDTNQLDKQVIELCQPLKNAVHICLIGRGDKRLDKLDIYPLAISLTRSGFSYVSVLEGGFHSIVKICKEYEDQGKSSYLPSMLQVVDLDWNRLQMAEKKRRMTQLNNLLLVPKAFSLVFGRTNASDIRHSLNRAVSKLAGSTSYPSTRNNHWVPSVNDKEKDKK
eukprot:jgi/Galph1/2213/GphlegSOOS_G910.1